MFGGTFCLKNAILTDNVAHLLLQWLRTVPESEVGC